jgi:hypothetical protein
VSFWPRKYWRTDLDALRRRDLAADPAFAKIGLVDSHILMASRQYGALRWKVLFLKLAVLSLAVAVPLSALGTTLE